MTKADMQSAATTPVMSITDHHSGESVSVNCHFQLDAVELWRYTLGEMCPDLFVVGRDGELRLK